MSALTASPAAADPSAGAGPLAGRDALPLFYDLRRFQSGLRVVEAAAGSLRVRSNFLVVQVLIDKPAEVAFVGVAHDRLVREAGELRLAERICVLDSEMLPNSLIYPI